MIDNLLFPIVTTLVAAFSGWFFGRRKQKAEAVSTELDAVEKAVAIWRQIAEDLKRRQDEQSLKIEAQTSEISLLREEVSTLRRDNARLLSELKAIKKNQAHEVDKKL